MGNQPVALVDFDRTLCPGDSIVAYLLFCIRRGAAGPGQLFRAVGGWLDQRLHPERVSSAKARTLSFIRGRARDGMDALAREFFREELLPRCREAGLREMERLRAEGFRTVVVSASPEVYMRVLPEFLPVDMIAATPCRVGEDGRYTGEVGPNCRGEEKVRRWRALCGDGEDRVALAYGDSANDIPMLRLADQPVLVCPDEKLRKAFPGARTEKW